MRFKSVFLSYLALEVLKWESGSCEKVIRNSTARILIKTKNIKHKLAYNQNFEKYERGL